MAHSHFIFPHAANGNIDRTSVRSSPIARDRYLKGGQMQKIRDKELQLPPYSFPNIQVKNNSFQD